MWESNSHTRCIMRSGSERRTSQCTCKMRHALCRRLSCSCHHRPYGSTHKGLLKDKFSPMTVSNVQPSLPSFHRRHFENACNDMFPVQLNHPVRGLPLASDRINTDPRFLKGKVEVRIFKQGKQSLSLACLSAGPVTYRLMPSS